MTMAHGWFDVDRKGLAEIAKRRGMAFIVTEAIQNAWDEDVTRVDVTMSAVHQRPMVRLRVEDDSPDGFRDLADAYTMFRESYKLDDPEKRGRFNVGEKLLLAVAVEASIKSTTGTIIFGADGQRRRRAAKTSSGSVLTATLRMTRTELEEALAVMRTLIPPPGIQTRVNTHLIEERTPLEEDTHALPTEIRGDEGGFRPTRRVTMLRVYDVLKDETAHLYEMGIPVDEIECPWHVEIAQKIPLSLDRSSVRHGFCQEVEKLAAEMMAKHMTKEQARGGWVGTALEVMDDPEAVRRVIKKRFGKAVIYDPSSPESNKLALDAGYAVISGGAMTKAAWSNVKDAGALSPAGRMFSDGRVHLSPDGVPPVPRDKWTKNMVTVAEYAGRFARHVLGHSMIIQYYDDARLEFNAFCGSGTIAINLAQVMPGAGGYRKAVEGLEQEVLDQLLIHECAHDKVSDHLTHAYHQECCRIGAKARSFKGGM